MTHQATHTTLCGLALAALAALAGCGDDDTAAAGIDPAYCDAAIALDQAFQAVDADDPSNFAAALSAAQTALTHAAGRAPSPVSAHYDVMEAALAEVLETGNPEAYFADDVVRAEAAAHEHDVEQCDWAAVDITAEDYSFAADWPKAAGPVSLDVTNAGDEPHVLIVARKLDTVSGSAIDVFNAATSEEEMVKSFEFVASVFVAPGTTDHALADLPSGDYIVFCPVPLGTKDEASIGEGVPHHQAGMQSTFVLK